MALNTEHNITLTEAEISVILFNLEEKYGHLLDGEIPEEVQTIFSKLEGSVDKYYEKVEKAKSKQPTMEWQIMEHTKGILLECNLSEEEINTVIEALSRDYVENDPETLEKEYQLQGKLREIISTFYTKIDAQKFTQIQVQSIKGSTL